MPFIELSEKKSLLYSSPYRLTKHREFQKALASKQPAYDQTMKTGKQLKDKAPKTDENTLKTMMSDMKTKWTTVCSKAVDR